MPNGMQMMMRGRMDVGPIRYPDLGAVLAREMGRADSKVPDYVTFYTQTEGRGSAPGDRLQHDAGDLRDAGVIATFRQRYPGVELTLRIANSQVIEDRVKARVKGHVYSSGHYGKKRLRFNTDALVNLRNR